MTDPDDDRAADTTGEVGAPDAVAPDPAAAPGDEKRAANGEAAAVPGGVAPEEDVGAANVVESVDDPTGAAAEAESAGEGGLDAADDTTRDEAAPLLDRGMVGTGDDGAAADEVESVGEDGAAVDESPGDGAAVEVDAVDDGEVGTGDAQGTPDGVGSVNDDEADESPGDGTAVEVNAVDDDEVGATDDGAETDGGASDGGASDGGASDGGASDGGASDGGASDGGASDGGASDGGASDGGASDGGASDGGASDGGASDGGASDGGASDDGASDGGSVDGDDDAAADEIDPPEVGASGGGGGGRFDDEDDDSRDRADFSGVTALLRRWGALPPARPKPAILVPRREQVLVHAGAPSDTDVDEAPPPPPAAPEADDYDQVNLSPLIEWAKGRDPVRWTLGAMVVVWSLVFITLGWRRHAHFGTFGFDLGIYDQGIWLLSRFKDPFVTVRGLDLFGHHMNVILLLFAPFYWLGAGPLFLLVAQVAAQASGAVAIFLLARDRLKARWPAVALASVILLHPSYQFFVWEYFHPDVLAIAPLLFAYWAARAKRWKWFAVAAVLAVACKEDVALAVIMLGIVIAIRGDRRIGAFVAAAATAWFVAATRIFIPHFNGIGPFYESFFGEFGRSPTEVVGHVVTHPGRTFDVATEPDRLNYYRMLFAPVAFLPVFALSTLLVGLPMLGVNVLSTFPYQRDSKFHWTAMILAAIVLATVEAIAYLGRTPAARAFLVGLVVATSLASTVAWGPSPLGVKYHNGYWPFGPDARLAAKEAAAALVPDGAATSAVYIFVPHLAHREKIYEFPVPWQTINWGVDGENPHDPAGVEWLVVDRQILSESRQDPDRRAARAGVRGPLRQQRHHGGGARQPTGRLTGTRKLIAFPGTRRTVGVTRHGLRLGAAGLGAGRKAPEDRQHPTWEAYGRVRNRSFDWDEEGWRDLAACRHTDVALFFPAGSTGRAAGEVVSAKAVCRTCPVQPACLRFALETNQESGIWGGRGEEERRRLRNGSQASRWPARPALT